MPRWPLPSVLLKLSADANITWPFHLFCAQTTVKPEQTEQNQPVAAVLLCALESSFVFIHAGSAIICLLLQDIRLQEHLLPH